MWLYFSDCKRRSLPHCTIAPRLQDKPLPCAVLNELLRAVKPGGYIVLDGHLQCPCTEYYEECTRQVLQPRWGPVEMQVINEWEFHQHKVGAFYWGPGRGAKKMQIYAQSFALVLRKPVNGPSIPGV